MTYSEPNKFENYGPEVYFGELKKINNSEIADVTEVGSKFKDKYRSIEGPGLSTIIPVVDFLKNNEIKNFIDFTLFTLFQSFVVWFSENEFEITVSDKKNHQIKTINNSNYKQEIENLSNSEIFDNDDFKYDYELFKTFALDKNINGIPENGVREIEVKKEYKGKINIKLFKNEKLKDYSNKPSQRGSRSTKLNKNFRIIRNGMTIRSEKFPQKITGLINPSLCGYITYDTAKLNELIGYLETASHDKFNYTRIEKAFFHDKRNFPSKQSVSKFINDSNKFLKEILEAISYSDSDIENTYFIKVDSGDENTNKGLKTESSSFYTNIKVERKMQKKENVIPKLLKPDLEGRKGGVVSNPGGDGEVEPPYFPGGPGGGGTRRVPGSRSKLSSINYLSKLIEKEGSNSKYLIQLANIKELDKFDLFITQDSISRNSITSFIIKNVEIRKKNIDSNADQIERKDFVEELNKNNLVKGYRISNIDCTNHEKLFIEIKLHEPSSTNSRFKITFLESI